MKKKANGEITRLQKFIEQGAYGEKSGRVAYAFTLGSLPQPNEGMDWKTADSFDVANEQQSWTRKFEQVDKWSFCLIAAMIAANRRDYEQKTAPEPHTGFQGQGGACRHQG
jgi:hypothetical protein